MSGKFTIRPSAVTSALYVPALTLAKTTLHTFPASDLVTAPRKPPSFTVRLLIEFIKGNRKSRFLHGYFNLLLFHVAVI